MVRKFGSWFSKHWCIRFAGVAILLGVIHASAGAEERCYVSPDGQKTRMIESTTELAVFLRDTSDDATSSCRRRLAASGVGVLDEIWANPGVRIKMLRVADTSLQRRDKIRLDGNIEEIRPIYRFEGVETPVVPSGELLFRVRDGLTGEELEELLADYGLDIVEPVEGLRNTYLAAPEDGEDELLRAEELAADDRTVWAQPNLIRRLHRLQSDIEDEYFDEQWHIQMIEAEEAWLIAEGQDILVGMFDDSCDTFHEDLRDRYIGIGQDASLPSNNDGYTDPTPKAIDDRHGTAVMGLAVAASNEVGGRGIAHLSRFTASRGLTEDITDFEIAGVYTFARQKDVDVHINSWGLVGAPNPSVIVDAIETAFREGRDLDGPGPEPPSDPPFGMVILFATGNENEENTFGSDLSSLPYVIGIGASNSEDRRASYSNYGAYINVLAPSGDDFLDAMFTTDNTDELAYPEPGYNNGGFDDFGFPEVDGDGNYTETFSGTSAACPVAAGVVALVLSKNPLLSATNVRLILEHTTDQIALEDAAYNGITNRSEKYGYGRLNARKAVEAAEAALTNGGRTWPDRVSTVDVVDGNTLRWVQSYSTDEFLVVQSDFEFDFIPQDGDCYAFEMIGCPDDPDDRDAGRVLDLPDGVEVLFNECTSANERCASGERHSAEFETPAGRKFFAIFARSSIGRYSFGVAVDSDGNVFDVNPVQIVRGGGGGDPGTPIDLEGNVSPTITAVPLFGDSPLTVQFTANAVSILPIDESKTAWDFDAGNLLGDGISINSRLRHAFYTYEVPPGQTITFRARLKMVDVSGVEGVNFVDIRVTGPGDTIDTGGGENDLRILAGVPGTVGSDNPSGRAPFEVELSIEAATLDGSLQSVSWDLGDGSSATSIAVPHTYENDTDDTLRFVVTAVIIFVTPAGTTTKATASRVITVEPALSGPTKSPDPLGEGAQGEGGAAGCGVLGMFTPIVALVSFVCLRRRFV